MTTRDGEHPPDGVKFQSRIDEASREKAAGAIQRTYRGHRTRRELHGFGLDPSTRWLEVVKDAQYQKITTPAPPTVKSQGKSLSENAEEGRQNVSPPVRAQWVRATHIARRAGADDRSPYHSGMSSEELSESQDNTTTPEERQKRHAAKDAAREVRKRTAKMMDLQYFLEMVDQKHRYGSSLRKYHNYWKTQDTTQNFFYWLDCGDGKDVELPECSRERLDKEQVRYLSREERLNYLVKIDDQGLLVWAKNGERVWTKDELFKDSMKGIVSTSDPTPKFKYNIRPERQNSDSSSSDSDETEEDEGLVEATGYVNESFHRARGPAKLKYVSAAALFNHMIRDSMKKGHKWIFVCDTSFRLYVGYKQSGSFQHSSFLHGSRITCAGIIKIKRGQLRSLAPLSGHYRTPTRNFRDFVHNLKEEGADMSRLNISKSYAILVGMESYTCTKKKVKNAEGAVVHQKDKLLHPHKVEAEQEAQQDKSQSAQRERQYLEQQRLERENMEKDKKGDKSLRVRISKTLSKLTRKRDTSPDEDQPDTVRRIPGTGPDDGIPAPEGKR